MISLRPFHCYHQSPFISSTSSPSKLETLVTITQKSFSLNKFSNRRKLTIRGCAGQGEAEKKTERRSFLSLEEAGLVEVSGLATHERFLCRLTISSLNLLRVISEQEGCSIEQLNAGKICDWFLKDKLKREQNLESAVLQWDDSDFQF